MKQGEGGRIIWKVYLLVSFVSFVKTVPAASPPQLFQLSTEDSSED